MDNQQTVDKRLNEIEENRAHGKLIYLYLYSLSLSLGIATNRHDHAIANIFLFEVNNRLRQLEAPLIKVMGRFYITARQLIGRTRRTCAL